MNKYIIIRVYPLKYGLSTGEILFLYEDGVMLYNYFCKNIQKIPIGNFAILNKKTEILQKNL